MNVDNMSSIVAAGKHLDGIYWKNTLRALTEYVQIKNVRAAGGRGHWRKPPGHGIMAPVMVHVLQMRVDFEFRPELPMSYGLTLRHFAGPDDIDAWLDIRHQAFAREKTGVRHWTRDDFEAEFMAKPWWSPQQLWFAELPGDAQNPSRRVGTVTRALRGSGREARPVVHWLAVLPGWRRRGVGRLLLSQLHQDCWDAGYRQVWLETHAGWQAAVRLYRELGYREVRR